jgi:hypothetical protein
MSVKIIPSRRGLTQGDQVLFKATIKKRSDGTIINLSGYTIKFRYWFDSRPITEVAATISDAANGIAQYQFTSGLSHSGLLHWEWKVSDGTYPVMSDESWSIPVRRKR